jgi:4-hydroxy-4-methyl-2-oxoglutarate aldolase
MVILFNKEIKMEKTLLKKFFKLKKYINSSILSDELDKLNLKNQVLTNWTCNNSESLMGFIRTMTLEDTNSGNENIKKGLGFLEYLKQDEILFVKGSNKFAYFGELMTRLSIKRGLKGVIISGKTRDSDFTKKIKKFTIFSKGYSPVDIKLRGRVNATDKNFKLNKTIIRSHDIVFGDLEGVVIIPLKNIRSLYPKVLSAIRNENKIKKLINKNSTVSEILNNFKEF